MRSEGGRAGVDSGQRQPGRSSRWMRVAALAYVVMLAVVTLAPIHWTLGLSRAPRNYEPQLVPFGGIRGDFHNSPVEALAELVGNVLLFAPFGFLLPLLVPAMRRWWRVLAAGAAVSWPSSCPSWLGQGCARLVSTTCGRTPSVPCLGSQPCG